MFKHINADFPASIVVFFVALPLCLGIALASDAPPLSGIIAGVVGGIVVGFLSGSKIGVSGPAAGLAAIVATSIATLGNFEAFLVAVVLSGLIQLLFGVLRMGIIAYFFPNSVIVGMLSGIGIIIILKQIPHLFGWDMEPMGADAFQEESGENTFSALTHLSEHITYGAIIIGFVGLALILFWDNVLGPKNKFFKLVQGPIIAVLVGTVLKLLFDGTALEISANHLVQIPIANSLSDSLGFLGIPDYSTFFTFPDFSYITNQEVWIVAFTLALVASLETLLCVEATDKLDPNKNITPTNRELFAQGAGNVFSGLIGGLPITQVIVRSSANIQSNGKTKLSTIFHGIFLLIAVLALPKILNHVPNAVLASVLIIVGYKLAKPALFTKIWKRGWTQFLPFIITILVIVFTDLLKGIFVGLTIGIIVILIKSFQNSLYLQKEKKGDKEHITITLAEEVTFLNKATIQRELHELPNNCHLELDIRKNRFLDFDVLEILEDFVIQAKNKNIHVYLKTESGNIDNPVSFIEFFKLKKQVD